MRALPLVLCALLVLSPVAGVVASPPVSSASAAPDGGTGTDTVPSASVSTGSGSVGAVGGRSVAARRGSPPAANVGASGAVRRLRPAGRNESVNVLVIPDSAVDRSGVDAAVVDVARGVAIGANATGVRVATVAVRERVESAENETARRQRIRAAMADLGGAIERLGERRRRVLAAYGAGELSERELLFRLVRIAAEAEALENRLGTIRDLAASTSEFELNGTRRATFQFELRAFGGPVLDRVAAVIRGEAPSTRVFVETGPNSVVVTTLVDGTYLRQSFRGPLRGPAGTVGPLEAENATARAYPTAWANRTVDRTRITGSGSIYVVEVPHEFGRLTAFVDGGSRNVFQEFQRRPLDSFRVRSNATAERDDLRLVLNRTYAGGPLQVRLVDADSGTPVDATITVAAGEERSDVVGHTGEDGTLWTLSPRGQYTITAIKDTRVVLLTVRSVSPEGAAADATPS